MNSDLAEIVEPQRVDALCATGILFRIDETLFVIRFSERLRWTSFKGSEQMTAVLVSVLVGFGLGVVCGAGMLFAWALTGPGLS